METIGPEATLAEIVNTNPELTRVLERHGLDYCCGGRRRLADACMTRNLDPAVVIDELTEQLARPAAAPVDWRSLDAAGLADHIEATHHGYLHAELPRLTDLLAKVRQAHADRNPELATVATIFETLRTDLEPHLMKEERVLFPMIRELAAATRPPNFHCGTLRNPITVMMREHDAAGDLLAWMRLETSDYAPPTDACASYRTLYRDLEALETDTHLHVHKENNVLFPLVERLEAQLTARP